MKISKNLPQFSGGKAVLAVAGTQAAKIFVAGDGELNEVAAIHMERLKFSDREGATKQNGRGMTAIMGSLNDHLKQDELKKFEKEFLRQLLTYAKNLPVTEIILFVPRQIGRTIQNLLPQNIKKLVKLNFYGNFLQSHPQVLLLKLQEKGYGAEPEKLTASKMNQERISLLQKVMKAGKIST